MATIDTLVPAAPEVPVWYAGIGNAPDLFNSEFITSLQSGTFDESYFELPFSPGRMEFVYYAQPVRMNFFSVWAKALQLKKARTMPITNNAGQMEDYDIWTSNSGPGNINIIVQIGENM